MFLLIFALVMLTESVILPAFFDGELPAAATAQPSDAPPQQSADTPAIRPSDTPEGEPTLDEDGEYTSKEDLALYIHLYGHLPGNFVTKDEAEAAGWTGGAVGKVLPGKQIGGDRYYNREGLLPKAKGRVWTECDVGDRRNTRGGERIIFSNDGLIYYTPDHYDSFELLYGEP
ncbi:MAG: ribonuclease [Oscillospiraceae bacterium]|nr:ribonuclease [Oscillospiraceae bacterium]